VAEAVCFSGIILAAGLSRRAAPKNKLLLASPSGIPVIRQVARAFCDAGLPEVIVVTGHQQVTIEDALRGLSLRTVFASEFELGMGHSLAAGVRAASPESLGFLVCPGDLPNMHVDLVRQVARTFISHRCEKNVVPTHNALPGHPVALVADLRPQLEKLTGDHGAKIFLSTPAETARTVLLPISANAIRADNDLG
jgi:molybdenum cofactor cytidylyltransferase